MQLFTKSLIHHLFKHPVEHPLQQGQYLWLLDYMFVDLFNRTPMPSRQNDPTSPKRNSSQTSLMKTLLIVSHVLTRYTDQTSGANCVTLSASISSSAFKDVSGAAWWKKHDCHISSRNSPASVLSHTSNTNPCLFLTDAPHPPCRIQFKYVI